MKSRLGTLFLCTLIFTFINCSDDIPTIADNSSDSAELSTDDVDGDSPKPGKTPSSESVIESSADLISSEALEESSEVESSEIEISSEEVDSSDENDDVESSENEESSDVMSSSSEAESSIEIESSAELSSEQKNEIGDIDLKLKGDTLDIGGIIITGVRRVTNNTAASDANPWMLAQLDLFPRSGAPVANIFYADLDSTHHVPYQILHMDRDKSGVPIRQIDYQFDTEKLLTQVGYQVLGEGQYLYFYEVGTEDFSAAPDRVRYQPQEGGNVGCKDTHEPAATENGCLFIETVEEGMAMAAEFYYGSSSSSEILSSSTL